jgi:hypothetical protein
MFGPVRTIVAVVLLASGAAGAEAPYVGKWKFNPTKSQLTGDTVTVESVPGGMMEFRSQGYIYRFKIDGKEYPTPIGGTVIYTAAGPDSWDVSNRIKGKEINTIHITVKGDTQTIAVRQAKPDGGTLETSATYKRLSGGPGLLGTWKSTEVKVPATVLELASHGANGIMVKDESGFAAQGQFDGKPNPAAGFLTGTKYEFSFRKVSDRAFEMTGALEGKPYYRDVYTVSADGKTLTDDGTPMNAQSEATKIVYDRQ